MGDGTRAARAALGAGVLLALTAAALRFRALAARIVPMPEGHDSANLPFAASVGVDASLLTILALLLLAPWVWRLGPRLAALGIASAIADQLARLVASVQLGTWLEGHGDVVPEPVASRLLPWLQPAIEGSRADGAMAYAVAGQPLFAIVAMSALTIALRRDERGSWWLYGIAIAACVAELTPLVVSVEGFASHAFAPAIYYLGYVARIFFTPAWLAAFALALGGVPWAIRSLRERWTSL